MSKSLGTGIDPVGLIETYGTDALRFGLAYQNTGVQDLKFGEDHILMGKKFANKFWNITKYVLIKTEGVEISATEPKSSLPIVKKAKEISSLVSQKIEELKFGEASHHLYDFIWHDIADNYLEETKDKNDEETKQVLAYLLITCLKLLHPFMPFITEEIYQKLPIKEKNLLMVERWPS